MVLSFQTACHGQAMAESPTGAKRFANTNQYFLNILSVHCGRSHQNR
jgi:hypothetical protein